MRRVERVSPPVSSVNPTSFSESRRLFHVLVLALVLVSVFLVYFGTLSFPFINWDDPDYVVENRDIRRLSFENLKSIFTRAFLNSVYIPLTMASLAVDYQLYGFNPVGYRLTNVFLHLANVALVYFLVLTLTKDWLIAIALALLFGIHPVQIESVVWITERKNVLSTFFILLAFACYILPFWGQRCQKIGPRLALVSLVLACFSKPNAVVVPVLLVLSDLCFGRFPRRTWFKTYAPFFLVSALFTAVGFFFIAPHGTQLSGGSFVETFVTMLMVMIRYFELLLLPLRQSLLYVMPAYKTFVHPHIVFSALCLVLVAWGMSWLWMKQRSLFFWAGWYWIHLLPAMHITPLPSWMNDRYLYLPLIGAFAVLLLLVRKRLGTVTASVLILFCLSGFTWLNLKRQVVWSASERFWLDMQSNVKGTHFAPYYNLGMEYLRQGRMDEAIAQLESAVRVSEVPLVYAGLGTAHQKKKDFKRSLAYFQKAIAIDPGVAMVHSNLALLYIELKNYDAAYEAFRKAEALAPEAVEIHNNLGGLLLLMNRRQEAEEEFLNAYRLDPDFQDSLFNLGMLKFEQGESVLSQGYLSRFLKLYPHHEKTIFVKQVLEGFKRGSGRPVNDYGDNG